MSAVVIDIDARRIAPYIVDAVAGFLNDPPDSEYQYGYLGALLNVWREGVGRNCDDGRLIAAEALLRRCRSE